MVIESKEFVLSACLDDQEYWVFGGKCGLSDSWKNRLSQLSSNSVQNWLFHFVLMPFGNVSI